MKTVIGWLYVWIGIILLLFVAPAMISMRDTFMVLMGVGLIVLYAVWSWHVWVKPLIRFIQSEFSDYD